MCPYITFTKVNKDEKLKGVGYLVEGNLLIPSTSSKGNAYIRVFEDVAEKCKAVKDTDKLRQTVVGRRRAYRHRLSVGGRFGYAQILPKKGSACRNRKCPDVRRAEAEEKSSINNAAIHNEGDC